jgi:hypothetical protein
VADFIASAAGRVGATVTLARARRRSAAMPCNRSLSLSAQR